MGDEKFEKELEEDIKAIKTETQVNEPPKEEYPNVRKLCIISLICYAVPSIVMSIGSILTNSFLKPANADQETYKSLYAGISYVYMALMGSYVAAWVLMIIARVKNKKDTFAKVLMIVYIVMAAIAIITFIVICIIAVMVIDSLVKSCGSSC